MAWTVELASAALRDFDKLESKPRERILGFLNNRLLAQQDPRQLGKALAGKKYENQWRYRVGDFRIVVSFENSIVTI
jgi:mRNA interferase RelE/StbE